jgi:hypothetical protein
MCRYGRVFRVLVHRVGRYPPTVTQREAHPTTLVRSAWVGTLFVAPWGTPDIDPHAGSRQFSGWHTADACVRLGEPSRSAYGYESGIAVTPVPAHIAQTVNVGLMVVLPVLVQVTLHVRSSSG